MLSQILLIFHLPIVYYISHYVRSNTGTDHLNLEPKLRTNFVKSQAIYICFVLQLQKYEMYILRLSVRHSDTVLQLERRLKSHYFNLAFCDVDDL